MKQQDRKGENNAEDREYNDGQAEQQQEKERKRYCSEGEDYKPLERHCAHRSK